MHRNQSNTHLKAGVIGFPISHSLSPIIHNFYLQKFDIQGSYEAFEIDVNGFDQSIFELIHHHQLKGFNVTIPHKERIINLCTNLSQSARNIGAVNTVKILVNGKIFGHNSDASGFINNLLNHLPNYNFRNQKIMVIGAGGASRAIIYGLIKQRVSKIFIANRTPEKTQKIITDFSKFASTYQVIIENVALEKQFNFLPDIDLIINSSSLGMIGQEKLDIDISNAKKSAVVYDIVYKPLYTNLLEQAQKLNLRTITGIGMLIEQALVGFEMWYGKKPNYSPELEKILLNKLTIL